MKRGLRELGRTGLYQRLPDSHNTVLAYHSVGGGGYDDIPPERLGAQLEWLTATYEVVDLPAVLERGDRKRIALTFDDALRSFQENVVPLLREYDVPATVFAIGGSVTDPPGLDSIRGEPLMTAEQLRAVADDPLVTVGSHTMTHVPLSEITDEAELHEEITGGTERVESAVGVGIDRFSYPFYEWSAEAREVVAERHEYAVRGEGSHALIGEDTDPYLVPRINGAVPLSTLRFTVSDAKKHLTRLS
ncbi:polysaccharide deacetylase family protein [Natronorarus salvus]|uniref:polysaccharide deacetylase family protein n=1 Tax=Natronorarus salvus TaxID=3117733 RepID=UPI002F260BFF